MSVPEIINRHSLIGLGLEHQRFTTKSEIKPWLQQFLQVKRGINIVIERSDANKIIFKCKSNKKEQNISKINGTSRRQNTCPFKIRANYSVRNCQWTLVIINDQHNHELEKLIEDKTSMSIKTVLIDQYNGIQNSSEMRDTSEDFGSFTGLASPDTLSNSLPFHIDNDGKQTNLGTEKKRKKTRSKKPNDLGPIISKNKSSNEIIQSLRREVHGLIQKKITDNRKYNQKEKSLLLKLFVSQIVTDYNNILKSANEQQKSVLNGWINTPSFSPANLNASTNTNLIPLSPLLNDVETEYQEPTANNNANQSLESLTHLPGINLSSAIALNSSISNGSIFSNQIPQIQNQGQQLPSFNSIQNQLPISPGGGNNTTASLFGNSGPVSSVPGSSALIPSINNTGSMTLNPSHLLKTSNSKSAMLINQSSLLNLNELKLNSTTNSVNNFSLLSSHTSNSNHGHVHVSTNAGLSSPNNNIINHSSSVFHNMGLNYTKDNNSGITYQNTNNGNSGGLNAMGSLSDSGW